MIVRFKSKETERIFHGQLSRHYPADIQTTARRKLRVLDGAEQLSDLRSPPENRLEALKGSRTGQHSIRINDQWRICFVWHFPEVRNAEENTDGEESQGGQIFDVEIADYH